MDRKIRTKPSGIFVKIDNMAKRRNKNMEIMNKCKGCITAKKTKTPLAFDAKVWYI